MFPPTMSRRSLVAGAAGTAVAAAVGTGIGRTAVAQGAITADIMRGEHPSQPIRNDAPAHLAITENTGVILNFQPVPSADWATKQQTLLATNQAPDLMYVSNLTDIREYTTEGVLTPLLALINEHAPNIQRYLASNPQFSALYTEDELFYLPALFFNFRRLAPMPMIRMDIVDSLGLAVPTNLEELLTTVKAMKDATPGGLGWTNRNNIIHFLNLMAYPLGSGLGIYFDEEVEGGKWVYGPTKPEFKAALEYLTRAYSGGVLDPEFSVTPADAWQTKNGSGQGLFTWDNMSFASNWNAAIRSDNADSAAWQPIPTLGGPLGPRQRDYQFIREGWGIGSNADDPVALVKMMDWMLTPEGIDTTNWGVEGVHFTRNVPLPETIEDYSAEGLTALMPSDRNTLLPEVYEEFAAQADPFRSYQSATGTGLLDFALGLDDTMTYLWTESAELDSWFEVTTNDPGLRKPVAAPSFTLDEAKQLQDLNRELAEILEPAYDQVILGQISLDDYDGIAEAANSAGATQVEEIYNTAQERMS